MTATTTQNSRLPPPKRDRGNHGAPAASPGRAPPRPCRPGRAAFSLVEMLVVLLIIGILAMAMIPGITGTLRDARLGTAAGVVVDALEFARQSAMASGRSTSVMVDKSRARIEVKQLSPEHLAVLLDTSEGEVSAEDVEKDLWTVMDHPTMRGQEYSFDLKDVSAYAGVSILSSEFGAGVDTVEFNAYGVPASTGLVVVTLGGRLAEVRLAAPSGRVSVKK